MSNKMKTENGKSVYPRLRILPPLHAYKVLLSCLSGRNSPISTVASEQQITDIERKTIKVPSSATEIISFLQAGSPDGRRVIFLHGTPGSARGWVDYLLSVPDGNNHIALDRPGYGFSSPRNGVVSLKIQAQAILPLLTAVGNRKPILVGHSLGACVAIQLALDFPTTIGGLLLLAGAFDPDLEEAHWLQPIGTFKPFSWLLPRTINNANKELLGLKQELLTQASRLDQITIPVSTVHGDKDPLVPIANLDYLQQKLINTSLDKQVLKDRDHFIPWNSKTFIDIALERLIDRVRKTEQ